MSENQRMSAITTPTPEREGRFNRKLQHLIGKQITSHQNSRDEVSIRMSDGSQLLICPLGTQDEHPEAMALAHGYDYEMVMKGWSWRRIPRDLSYIVRDPQPFQVESAAMLESERLQHIITGDDMRPTGLTRYLALQLQLAGNVGGYESVFCLRSMQAADGNITVEPYGVEVQLLDSEGNELCRGLGCEPCAIDAREELSKKHLSKSITRSGLDRPIQEVNEETSALALIKMEEAQGREDTIWESDPLL